MSSALSLFLGVTFITLSIFSFVRSYQRRHVLLDRLYLRRRRVSGSSTPPRCLSPEKQPLENNSTPDYSDIFPPCRRHSLGESVSALTVPPSTLKEASLPLTMSYLETKTPMFTPCGFSINEIKALGDFPDYAELSGVPLPQPYHGFDIRKALPRPYRPFRWSYHQTMCK
jgi:hypothetical protein